MVALPEPSRIDIPVSTSPIRGKAASHVQEGDRRFDSEEFEEAAKQYEAALKLATDNPYVLNNLGVTLARIGRVSDSLSAMQRAAKGAPKDAIILRNLGLTYAALGRNREAVQTYDRALALRKDVETMQARQDAVDASLWKLVAEGKAHWNGGKPTGSKKPLKMPAGVNVSDYIIRERDALRGPQSVILYLDSSSLLKLYLDEGGSTATKAVFERAERAASSLIAYAEVRAALASARRGRRINSAASYDSKKQEFEQDWVTLFHLDIEDEHVQAAGALAERHSLSGFDSIHLATAIALREAVPDELQISTWDKRLASAALSEGFVLAHEVTS